MPEAGPDRRSGASRRRHKRWSRRLAVTYWDRAKPQRRYSAYTQDVSSHGTYIATQSPFKKGSRLEMEFSTENGTVHLGGEVRFSKSVPKAMQRIKMGGMGIRFLRVEELIREILPGAPGTLVEGQTNSTEQPGQAPEPTPDRRAVGTTSKARPGDFVEEEEPSPEPPPEEAPPEEEQPKTEPEAPQLTTRAWLTTEELSTKSAEKSVPRELGEKVLPAFTVDFESRDAFLEVYERDLKFGGLFVSTPAPAALDSAIELVLVVTSDPRVELRLPATVVHVMDQPSRSPESNLLAGMGVQVTDQDALRRLSELATPAAP